MQDLTRRDMLKTTGAAAGAALLASSPFVGWAQETSGTPLARKNGKRIVFFTKSQGFPHTAVTRKLSPDGKPLKDLNDLAFGEKLLKQWAENAGYDIVITKEGSFFTPENIAAVDAFVFYTTGILTDPPGTKYTSDSTSAMTPEGKVAFLKGIEGGKGFIGLHCAADTFENAAHGKDPVRLIPEGVKVDPYCAMLGAEFTSHGSQQSATIRVGSKTFPGLEDIEEFTATEEWYSFTNLARDLHVILVQDTATMKVTAGKRETQYQGEAYPETWARLHGKGRVFYTSMGHREDIWAHPRYQKLLLAALAWGTGLVKGDVATNVEKVCPGIATVP